jgi:hypothetical protein
MGQYHAVLSPSSAHRWVECTASPEAQRGRPNTTNPASRHGTCGHQIGAECLERNIDAVSYIGKTMVFWAEAMGDKHGECWDDQLPAGCVVEHTEVVTSELAEAVQSYVNFVRKTRDLIGAEMIVEQRVPIDHITGETDATGTSDCILLTQDEIICIDLKLGRGKVMAYDVMEAASYDLLTGEEIPPKLRMNLQQAMYIGGSIRKHAEGRPVRRARSIIVQPYLNSISEYGCDIAELNGLLDWLRQRAQDTRKNPEFKPSNDNCFFCKAKFDCHARTREVLESCLDGFDDVPNARPKPITIAKLGDLYDKVAMIRSWCDDVEAKVHDELMAGRPVGRSDGKRFTLKVGRRGDKKWDDPNAIEALMKSWRFKEDVIYTKKLITPSAAEKIAEAKKGRRKEDEPKKPIGKKHWNLLLPHIKQEDGKPVIALETDPRPNYVPKNTGFDDVPEPQPPADNSDLF